MAGETKENNVIVLGFDGEFTAGGMLEALEDMQDKGILVLEDAVIASRGAGRDVKIEQTQSVTGKYTLRGSGVGLVAGLLLGGPIGGLIGGAAVGAISGALKDVGIGDKFVNDATQALGPDSSALFLMGRATDPERFAEEIKPYKATVASTTLSPEQEKNLKALLAEEG